MTILFLDGFEMYTPSGDNKIAGLESNYLPNTASSFTTYFSISDMATGCSMPGSVGSRALVSSSSSSTNAAMFYPANNLLEICVGMHVKVASNNSMLFYLGNSGAWTTNRIGFYINATGIPSIYTWVGSTGTTYTSETQSVDLNMWNYYELRVQVSGQLINAWAYRNGKQVATISNISVLNANASYQNIDRVMFGYPSNGSGATASISYDNFYVSDGEVVGPMYISPLLPTSDTAQKDWGSTNVVTNYTEISEVTGGDITTQVVSSAIGDKDYYNHSQILVNDGIFRVKGIQSEVVYSTDTQGTTQFKTKGNTGTTEFDLDTISVPIGSDYNKQTKMGPIITNNPDTSSTFTISQLNNLKIGLERTS